MAHTARAKNFPSKKLARKILLRNKHDRTTKTLGDACLNNVPKLGSWSWTLPNANPPC